MGTINGLIIGHYCRSFLEKIPAYIVKQPSPARRVTASSSSNQTHKINTTICPTLLLNQPTTKSLSAPIAFGSRKADRKDGRSTIGYKLSYSLLLLLSGRRGRLRKRRKSPQNDHIHRKCSVCWNCLHVRQTVHDLWSYSPHSCRRDCGIPLVIEIDCTRPRAASATGAVFY